MAFDQEQRPRGRRTSLILAAVFVVAIVIAGLVVGVVVGLRGPSTAHPYASTTTGPSGSASDTGRTAEGACGEVPYLSTNDLNSAPTTTWAPWSATSIATSSAAGPSKDVGGVRTCYARTPTGALFAAFNFAQYCSDSTVLPLAMQAVLASGAGKSVAVQQASTAEACQPSGQYVEGFKLVSYDGSAATLYLALNAPAGLAEYGVQLVWEQGDWKVVTDSQGNSPIATNQLSSITGFIPWGPTNG